MEVRKARAGERKGFSRGSTNFDTLEPTVNTGSASRRLHDFPIVPSPSNFMEADSVFFMLYKRGPQISLARLPLKT